jgi:CheY-like chemotaxis protein
MDEPLLGVRVLLVDDDEDTRALYAFALGGAGAEVRTAADGAEAVRLVEDWRPAVIVSDLVMPETDAGSLLSELRSLHSSPHIPAIAVTGRSSARDRQEALAAGFEEHAPKPLIPQDLIATVKRCATSG